jgi:hypothetical protein
VLKRKAFVTVKRGYLSGTFSPSLQGKGREKRLKRDLKRRFGCRSWRGRFWILPPLGALPFQLTLFLATNEVGPLATEVAGPSVRALICSGGPFHADHLFTGAWAGPGSEHGSCSLRLR